MQPGRNLPFHEYSGHRVTIHPPEKVIRFECKYSIHPSPGDSESRFLVSLHEGVGYAAPTVEQAQLNAKTAAHEWIDMQPKA